MVTIEIQDNQEEIIVNVLSNADALSKHSQLILDDGSNPHNTTKEDVGLGDVLNSDLTPAVTSNANEIVLLKAFDKNIVSNVATTHDLDYSDDVTFYKLTLTADTTITESNLPDTLENTTITLKITGAFALTLPTEWGVIDGDSYDGSVWNFYAVQRTDVEGDVFLSNKAT
tara:strand:- start:295 stop:807 length:513 start_codon:yes stop_codon:yes gene_type:complete